MPQAKSSKSRKPAAAKRNLGKAKMKGTKGGIIVVCRPAAPTTALIPAVQSGFCDGSV